MDPLLRLRTPAPAWGAAVLLGLVCLVPLGAALAQGRVGHPLLQVMVAVVGVAALALGLDAASVRVDLGADGAVVRRWGRATSLRWEEVKGVSLVSDGGVPRLKVVGVGRAAEVPAWGLVARHPDGEVEVAADALPRFGAAHGVRVRVRTVLSQPPRQPDPPRRRSRRQG